MRNIKDNGFKPSKKAFYKVLSILLVVSIMISSSFVAFSMDADTAPNPIKSTGLGLSSLGLGTSSITIDNEEALLELSDRVNDGQSFEGVTIVLAHNLDLAKLDKWQPIGTKDNPFNGFFDGNKRAIFGIGQDPFTSLFGNIKNATIKDLLVVSSRNASDNNPYYGLFLEMETSTIENCQVEISKPSISSFLLRRSSIVPDISWFEKSNARSFKVIDTPEKLLGLQVLTNGGYGGYSAQTFSTDIIILSPNLDMSFTNRDDNLWMGIGMSGNAFSGTVYGGTVSNLTATSVEGRSVGLFGYTENATIEDINLVNVNINGTDGVGGIVGTAYNTRVANASVFGMIKGSRYVGGHVGKYIFTGTAGSDLLQGLSSDSDVSGVTEVGGLIGQIEIDPAYAGSVSHLVLKEAYTTGTVTGTMYVGGVVGFLSGVQAPIVTEIASTSTIHATGNAGGLIGSADGIYSLMNPGITNSYFAGNLYGFGDVGGIAGSRVSVDNCYVSGHVIAPDIRTSNNANYGVGLPSPALVGTLFADSHSLYAPDNVMNKDQSTGAQRKAGDVSSFFQDSPNGSPGGAFTNATLTYGSNPGEKHVESGFYPQLTSFNSRGGDFAEFSRLSTNASLVAFPTEFFLGSDGSASITAGGASYPLPSGNWKLNGSSKETITDITLEPAANAIEVQGNKFVFKAALNKEITLPITYSSGSVKFQYTATFRDQAVRPVAENLQTELYTSVADLKAGTAMIPTGQYVNYVRFDEPMTFESAGTASTSAAITITKHSSADDLINAGTSVGTGTATIVNGNSVRIQWNSSLVLENGAFYKIALPAGTKLGDIGINGLVLNQYSNNLYVKTPQNTPPTLSFVLNDELAQSNPDNINQPTAQTVILEEKSVLANSLWTGVWAEDDEGYADKNDTTLQITNFQVKNTVAGSHPSYPATTVTAANFMNIPGTYEVTYQLKDPADKTNSALYSNTITRTYCINGATNVTQGGKPLNLLNAYFGSQEMLNIYNNSQGLAVPQTFENALIAKYITKNSADQMAAFYVKHTGETVNEAITFDTSVLTEEVFARGFQQALIFKVGSKEYTYILSLAGNEPDIEIVLENSNFMATNALHKSDAIRHINAKVINKTTGLIDKNYSIKYDFSKVHSQKFDIPQEVTIYIPSTDQEVFGKNLLVSTKATVIIRRFNYAEAPTDVPKVFWEETLDHLETRSTNSNMNYTIPLEAAKYTPADYFIILRNKGNATSTLTFESNIKMTFESSKIDKSLVDSTTYNITLEPMYDMAIRRDAGGQAVQQFRSITVGNLPATATVSMPLEKGMPTTGLNLYYIDEDSGRYVQLEKLDTNNVRNDQLVLAMDQLLGKYVISSANLDGKISNAVER